MAVVDGSSSWDSGVQAADCTSNISGDFGAKRVELDGVAGCSGNRPRMLIDDLIENGSLALEEAKDFEHSNICVTPFVGQQDSVDLTSVTYALRAQDIVAMAHAMRLKLDRITRAPSSAAELAAQCALVQDSGPVLMLRS